MSKSIISNDRICLVCGTTFDLHKHHIFYGTGKIVLSEKYGCWCYLCARHHNMSNDGVHFNKKLDEEIKKQCQIRWEEENPEKDFIKVFGRNYL